MKLNRQAIIVVIVLIVVIIVAIFALLVFPQFGKLASLEAEVLAAEIDVSSAETLLSRRQAAKGRSAHTESQLMRLANELPESPELASVIVELQNLMNLEGLELSQMSPSVPSEREGFAAVTISLSFEGRWIEVVNLLQDLPSMTRQVRVVSFNTVRVLPEEAEEETPVVVVEPEETVAVSMVIEVYTMPQNDAAPAEAAPAAPGQ